MSKYKIGFPKVRWEKGIPRILIKESLANRTKWGARFFTAFCVFISVISFPWYIALLFSCMCAAINLAIEKVIFYYVIEINFERLGVPYDSSKWVMNGFLWQELPKLEFLGNDEISIVFNDLIYASEFFKLLQSWHDTTELKVSFVIDEDLYFVYLYPDHDSELVDAEIKRIEEINLPAKLLNKPFAEIDHLTICKSFPVGDFALGRFIEHHPENAPCRLTAYYSDGNTEPKLIESIAAVNINGYKARVPSELTMNEYEGAHWKIIVEPNRKALGA